MNQNDIMKLRDYTPQILAAAGIGFTAYIALYLSKPKLKNFYPHEFGIWWPFMDNELLQKLDAFRTDLKDKVIISPVGGAIGRIKAAINDSQHVLVSDLTIRAVDIMVPKNLLGINYSRGGTELKKVFDLALAHGFRGVGVYPKWAPYSGLHLDTRPKPKNKYGNYWVDTWSGIYNAKTGQNSYGAVSAAFV
jgi:hypothetical protein